MRKIIMFAICLLVAACKKEINHEEIAANAAQQYYSYLMNGDYEAFVDGTYRADTIRPAYRQQLLDNMKMFVAQQQEEHQGIKSFTVKRVELDSLITKADVFLILTYGDSCKEEVLLPMVQHEGLWYLR